MIEFNVPKFRKASENLADEQQLRMMEADRGMIPFGIRALDDALRGIAQNDLVLIGARSGVGKTEICTMITESAQQTGKTVHYIALEAEDREIERRMKYRLLVEAYRKAHGRNPFTDYDSWRSGDDKAGLDFHYQDIKDQLMDAMENVYLYYRDKSFGILEMTRMLTAVHADTDLIIIDHLHYFDTHDQNEIKAFQEIVKCIRDIVLIIGKPIVLVAHLRKPSKENIRLPDLEDFMGTSDTYKVATKSIILASGGDIVEGRYPTLCRVGKHRRNGAVTRTQLMLYYNATSNRYEDRYELVKVTDRGPVEINPSEHPVWYKLALERRNS